MIEIGNNGLWYLAGNALIGIGLFFVISILCKKKTKITILLFLLILLLAGIAISTFSLENLVRAKRAGYPMRFKDLKEGVCFEAFIKLEEGISLIGTMEKEEPDTRIVMECPNFLEKGMRFKIEEGRVIIIEKKPKEFPKIGI